jgi:ABC-type polysaccharide transport system permease subunit
VERSPIFAKQQQLSLAIAYQLYALILNLGNMVRVDYDHLVWLIRPSRLYFMLFFDTLVTVEAGSTGDISFVLKDIATRLKLTWLL